MKTKFLGIAMLLACVLVLVGCQQAETPEAPTFPSIEILPVTIGDVRFVNFKGSPLSASTNPTLSSVQAEVNAIDSSVSYLSGGWNSNVFSLTSSSTIDGNDWNDFKKQIQKNSSAEIVYSVDDFFPDNVVVSVISQVQTGNIKFVNSDGELLEGYLLEDTITKINALEASPGTPLITKMFTNAWDVTTADITLSNKVPLLGDWTKLKEGVNALSTEDVRVRFNDEDTENVEIEVTDEINIGKISLVNLAGEPLVDTASIEVVTAKITDPVNTNFAGLFALPWDIAYADYIPQEIMVSINAWNTFVENVKAMNDANIIEISIDDSDKENVIVTVNNGYVVDNFTLIGFDGDELSADTVPSVADIAKLLNTETSLSSMFGTAWNEDSAIYQPIKDTSYATVTNLATLIAEIDALNTNFLAVAVSEEVLETGAKAYTIKVEKPYSRITFTGPNNSPLSESILNTTRTIISGIQSGKWNQHVFTPSNDIADWESFKTSLNEGLAKNNLVAIVNEDNRADIYVTVKDTLDILGFTLVNNSELSASTARSMFASDLTGDEYGGSWNGNYFSFTNTEISIADSTNFVNTLKTNLSGHERTDALVDVNVDNKENIIVTVRDPFFYVKSSGSNSNNGLTLDTAFATPQKAVDEVKKLHATHPNIHYVIKIDGAITETSSKNWGMVNVTNDGRDGTLYLTIESASEDNQAILNAKNLGRVLYVNSTEDKKVDLSLNRITLTGGNLSSNYGAGIWATGDQWLSQGIPNDYDYSTRIAGKSLIVVNNQGEHAVYLAEGVKLELNKSTITGNANDGLHAVRSHVTLSNGTLIEKNMTGHGVYASYSKIFFQNGAIQNNGTASKEETRKNGVRLTYYSSLSMYGDYPEIRYHKGSGVYIDSTSSAELQKGAISQNGAYTGSGHNTSDRVEDGGGVNNYGTFRMLGGYIFGNYAKRGGGIHSGGLRDNNGDWTFSSLYLGGGNIYENDATSNGGGYLRAASVELTPNPIKTTVDNNTVKGEETGSSNGNSYT